MTKPIIDIADASGLIESREMTDVEYAEWLEIKAKVEADQLLQAQAADDKKVVLDKLGLTEDEAKLLLA